ncbi:MAG: NAD(P)-binding domain-containing protein [Polyangiales bacterium]
MGRYARWLHTGFPAGTVERLPLVGEDGSTSVVGVRIAGDLVGTPLLKLAADSGARAIRAFASEPSFADRKRADGVADVAIVGAGVAGLAAALEARRLGLEAVVLEASRPFQTIRDFPAKKPIYLYPSGFVPEGELALGASTKEELVDELEAVRRARAIEPVAGRVSTHAVEGSVHSLLDADGRVLARAHRILLAIGKSGDHRKLGIPGEDLPLVHHRLHDPADFAGRSALVVGGGDSAVEAALALAEVGARVTLVHRGSTLVRPKAESLSALDEAVRSGRLVLRLGTQPVSIRDGAVEVEAGGVRATVPVDVVFAMVGREAPLPLLRRFGIPIRGEHGPRSLVALGAFLLFCLFVYTWKSGGELTSYFRAHRLFPFFLPDLLGPAGARGTFARALAPTLEDPGFHYSTAYSLAVLGFGLRRMRRRPTPYVVRQTWTLIAIQWTFLFLVPYVLLPWLGAVGVFDSGFGKTFADAFFPTVTYGHGREYWRAFGFVLAWPLFLWNVFTSQPMKAWLVVSLVQTFVIVPWIVKRWGKGAYCGWVCSCGALAETMGDAHREKMPHGPTWNRLNLLGQLVLGAALLLFGLRLATWLSPGASLFGVRLSKLYGSMLYDATVLGVRVDYYHVVDLFFAGVLGVGLYFWFSGRTWCRFACPLAALMHVYARTFGRFRIFSEKKKCISCGRCTAVCHQGIDVMHFAQRGRPMDDPQCVRCSACVDVCPTGVLSFGRLGADGQPVLDRLEASGARLREGGKVHLPVVR